MLGYELLGLFIIVSITSAQDGNVDRRVTSFIGTRGKKSDTDIEKETSIIDFDPLITLEDTADEIRYKRGHTGFQGTRGKKMSETAKKKSLSFTGKIEIRIFK